MIDFGPDYGCEYARMDVCWDGYIAVSQWDFMKTQGCVDLFYLWRGHAVDNADVDLLYISY